MPKRFSIAPAKVTGLVRLWNNVRSLSVTEIAQEAERPFTLALIGSPDETKLLAARLALETPTPQDSAHGPADIRAYMQTYAETRDAAPGSIALLAEPLTADESRLAARLAEIVVAQPALRLSLARHIPAFRPAVVAQIISEESWKNAKIATLSALPGIFPLGDVLLPATALGDMVLLTKNQGMLLLRIAAAYGHPVDLRARFKELLPVVGSAFGWRAVARELVGLVPGGIGVVIKGSIAYAGTYTVGKAAAIYYSTGQTLSGARLNKLYRDSLKDAAARVRQWLRRDKSSPPPPELEVLLDGAGGQIDKPVETKV